MNVILTNADDTASQVGLLWQQQLDALACGECAVDDFIEKFLRFSRADADLAWNVVALLDQRFRRGEVPADVYRCVESKIVRRELNALSAGTTIEFDSTGAAFRVTTERYSAASSGARPVTMPLKSPPPWAQDRWESPAAEVGRVLRNRYVLEARLGRGGMGTVFKALDRYRCDLPEDNRHVAIKFLHESVAGTPEVLSNLRSEFYCAQALSHPNIVKVYELDQDHDVVFFTMEFLEGELLSDVIERLKPQGMPRSQAWAVIRDLGSGLAHAHARNVTHGDLKPQNIMITRTGEVRILDFGASSALSHLRAGADEAHKHNSTALTPAYACCELLAGAAADPRDDLYALACVSYELLAGQHPFHRRRSTEARALGLVAQRPHGLSRRQWETLALGLSWERQIRSISVGDWIAGLDPPWVATRQWARSLDLKSIRLAHWNSWSIGAVAALVVSLVSVVLWTTLNRHPLESRIAGAAAVPELVSPSVPPAVVSAADIAGAPASPPEFSFDAAFAPEPAATGPGKPDILPVESPAPRHVRIDPARLGVRRENDNISITAGYYKIGSRQNFAEIRVRRSSASVGNTSFVWWTEPSTALPGVDYMPQARITQPLPNGSHTASLFVRLVPRARQHPAAFYVAIGQPSGGASLGRVARTTVLLPASR